MLFLDKKCDFVQINRIIRPLGLAITEYCSRTSPQHQALILDKLQHLTAPVHGRHFFTQGYNPPDSSSLMSVYDYIMTIAVLSAVSFLDQIWIHQ